MTKKFEFIPAKRDSVTKEKIIEDLKLVSKKATAEKLTQKLYLEYGEFNTSTVIRRFKTWNKAIEEAGLKISNRINIPEEELFNNILVLWEYLGHQPRRSDLENKISSFSQSPYNRHFGSSNNSLKSFVT